MARTTISIDESIASMVKERAKADNISVSAAFSMLAKGYAERRIHLGAYGTNEPEIEVIPVSAAVRKKMDRIESLL